jgi:hypothetical protein
MIKIESLNSHSNHLSHRARESKLKLIAKAKEIAKESVTLPTAHVVAAIEKLQLNECPWKV